MRIAVNENDPISIRNAILLLQQRMDGSSVAWDDVTDKPTTFPPEAHTHSGDDITSAVGEAAHAGSADTATNADYANSAASADSVLWADIPDKPMSFPPDAHNHDTAYEPKNANIQSHITNTSNPHAVTKTQISLGNVTNDAQVKRSEMGAASGVATLGVDGRVPSAQLPVIDSITAFRRGWFGC